MATTTATSITQTLHVFPEEEVCLNCCHFYQHYVQDKPGEFIGISFGHCVYPRIKDRKALDTCKYFTRPGKNTVPLELNASGNAERKRE